MQFYRIADQLKHYLFAYTTLKWWMNLVDQKQYHLDYHHWQ